MDRSVKWTAVLRPPISRPFNNSLSITATFHLIVYLHFPSYSWSHLHSRHLATSSLEVRPAGSVSHSSCPGFKCSLEIRDTTGISRHQLKRFGLSNNILGRTKMTNEDSTCTLILKAMVCLQGASQLVKAGSTQRVTTSSTRRPSLSPSTRRECTSPSETRALASPY